MTRIIVTAWESKSKSSLGVQNLFLDRFYMYIIIIHLLYLYRLLIDKAQGMPGYVRHMLTDLLTTHQLQIVSLLQYQTEFDDFTWPEFERITGHPTVIERKRSMLHTKNKWAFHTSVSGLSVYNTVKWFGILVIINEGKRN